MVPSVEQVTERTWKEPVTSRRHEGQRPAAPYRISVLGVRADNIDGNTALNSIGDSIASRDGRLVQKVYFINVHTIHLARRDSGFLRCVNAADLILPDGSGLDIAGKLFGNPIVENLNGTDFTPKILREAERKGWTVYLLGSKPDVLKRCRKCLEARFPHLTIVGDHPGYFSIQEERDLVRTINSKRPDILLVALGSPRQELWIDRHAHELRVGVAMAVGGLFDFLSGERKRAPVWMRRVGIEWIFRFIHDPRSKWERVLIEIPLFLSSVLARWCVECGTRWYNNRMRISL